MDFFQTFGFPAIHPHPSYSVSPKPNYDEQFVSTVCLRFLAGTQWDSRSFVPSTREPASWNGSPHQLAVREPHSSEYADRPDLGGISKPLMKGEEKTVNTKPVPCASKTGNASRKRLRTTFTGHQLSVMEKQFELNRYIGSLERKEISETLGLTEGQVKIWWQNRRIKERKSAPKPGRSFSLE
ncbi:hypothetical protein RvY_09441 [Ramazzottius varieornatus]|uniref:Homeobox domain-containing protein n=1 Tax=Ramazzottius varieornatus TaxID=947166 RepID=A0A1D1VDX7_RAMVA|nr:hypothetical protein RvY_09441 [Ramazzottius varieornatus]